MQKDSKIDHVEDVDPETDRQHDAPEPEEVKRVLRKVDWRVIPILGFLYIMCYMDRSNIGNAKVAGMSKELHLTGEQYNIALTMFFIPYALLEVPSNFILKLLRPSLWIGILMLAWGTVMTLFGVVQSFPGLTVARAALGVAEAGFFPASAYLLTTWYRRLELQQRLAIFYSAGSVASAFSGLLAFSIGKMDGIRGLGGWRWIFLVEGAATVAFSLIPFLLLPDSPETSKFLTSREKKILYDRLRADAGTESGEVELHDKFHWPTIRSAFLEWKIWVAIIIYLAHTICAYGFSYTVPTVIFDLGYSAANAQLLTIPIYAFSAMGILVLAHYSDKCATRWPFIVGPFALASVGFIALLALPQPGLPGVTYGFLFCIPLGANAPLVALVTWIGNNLAPSWKRAIGMALLISVGNLGGSIGTNLYLERQKPHYWLGYGFGLGMCIAAIIATLVLKRAYENLNRQREAEWPESEVRQKYTNEELLQMGDKSPLFRYIV
ncbi:hypothetical protein JDV02_003408 [Purpureocillium takamizusanense]|uniref:Major facilitator superfamily (MFS) profile domain-containing protein n=1 Tax=Purpureocillium takamizusanense TaxID=2060973 RepID=A0A9Q8V9M7_9HYPO|nr:uncharacterized protein JDV02_003408 [Purpureocillium takamizusanense]UNI17029.1 hypothetical protein JDV02_003408 [Purpureocillium takamizusanense]